MSELAVLAATKAIRDAKAALKLSKDALSVAKSTSIQIGPKGSDGLNGSKGLDGSNGVDGINGINGLDGKDGISLPGINGINGRDGINGLDGSAGLDGMIPNHEWKGESLRFQNPDGSWGKWVDLRGARGSTGGGGGSTTASSSEVLMLSSYTDTTIGDGTATLLVDASGGVRLITLPSASNNEGSLITVKKIDSSTNNVRVSTIGVSKIDGEDFILIGTQWTAIRMQSNGTDWMII